MRRSSGKSSSMPPQRQPETVNADPHGADDLCPDEHRPSRAGLGPAVSGPPQAEPSLSQQPLANSPDHRIHSVFDGERSQSRHIGPTPRNATRCCRSSAPPRWTRWIDEAIPGSDSAQEAARHRRRTERIPVPVRSPPRRRAQSCLRSFIGLGYYDTITPSVIPRNVLENPGWSTPVHPHQAEIAQDASSAPQLPDDARDLTGMEIANASLLDEATAAAEAMTMLHRVQAKRVDSVVGPAQFLVADSCYPQTLDLSRRAPSRIGIEVVVMPIERLTAVDFGDRVFGALSRALTKLGRVHDLRAFIARAATGRACCVAVGTILSLVLLTSPRRDGRRRRLRQLTAHSVSRLAAAARTRRSSPRSTGTCVRRRADHRRVGRRAGNTAYRMALQDARAAHSPRSATSNICTAQALLANIAGLYASVTTVRRRSTSIARRVHACARLANGRAADGCHAELNSANLPGTPQGQ